MNDGLIDTHAHIHIHSNVVKKNLHGPNRNLAEMLNKNELESLSLF